MKNLSLQIMLYYDDLEACNPLGSKAKIHKLGIRYRKYIIAICANFDYAYRCILFHIGEHVTKAEILFGLHPVDGLS